MTTAFATIASTALVPVEGFDSDEGLWADIQFRFQMDERRPEEILIARYEQDSYEGKAVVLYRNGGSYFYVSGSHCSCFGLEDQWEPEEYSLEILIAAIERAGDDEYGFCRGQGVNILPTLKTRLKRKLARERKALRLAAS